MIFDDRDYFIGFIKPSNDSLVEYVKNVDNLFVAKTCQAYLLSARRIFDKNLHDMVQVRSNNFRYFIAAELVCKCSLFSANRLLRTCIKKKEIQTILI